MPHNGRDGSHACAPGKLIEKHREGIHEKVFFQPFVSFEHILHTDAHYIIFLPGIIYDNNDLNSSRAQRADSRTCSPQGGSAQKTEDKNRIEDNIDGQGCGIHHRRDHYTLNTPDNIQIYIGKRCKYVGKRHDPKIAHTLRNDRLV